MMKAMDKDEGGDVSFDEFAVWWQDKMREQVTTATIAKGDEESGVFGWLKRKVSKKSKKEDS